MEKGNEDETRCAFISCFSHLSEKLLVLRILTLHRKWTECLSHDDGVVIYVAKMLSFGWHFKVYAYLRDTNRLPKFNVIADELFQMRDWAQTDNENVHTNHFNTPVPDIFMCTICRSNHSEGKNVKWIWVREPFLFQALFFLCLLSLSLCNFNDCW